MPEGCPSPVLSQRDQGGTDAVRAGSPEPVGGSEGDLLGERGSLISGSWLTRARISDDELARLPGGYHGLRVKRGTADQIIEMLGLPDSKAHRSLVGYHLKNAVLYRPSHLGRKKLHKVVGGGGRQIKAITSTSLVGYLQALFPEMRVVSYNRHTAKARAVWKQDDFVHSGVPEAILDLLLLDRSGELSYRGALDRRVDFATLKSVKRKPRKRRKRRGESKARTEGERTIETERDELIHLLESQPTNEINGLLRRRAPAMRTAAKEFNAEKARLAKAKVENLNRSIAKTTDKQRPKYQKQLGEAMRKQAGQQQFARSLLMRVETLVSEGVSFEFHGVRGSFRAYSSGPSVMTLPVPVRDALLDEFIQLDLVAAHLTIFAAIGGCEKTLKSIDTSGIEHLWADLTDHVFDRRDSTSDFKACKRVVKVGILAAIFGARPRRLAKIMNALADDGRVRRLSSATSLQIRLFEGHLVAKEVIERRNHVISELSERGAKEGVHSMRDCLGHEQAGDYIIHSDLLRKGSKTMLAKVVSSYEVAIIGKPVRALSQMPEVGTILYLYDGLYVSQAKKDRGAKKIIEAATAAANPVAKAFGVPTVFQSNWTRQRR